MASKAPPRPHEAEQRSAPDHRFGPKPDVFAPVPIKLDNGHDRAVNDQKRPKSGDLGLSFRISAARPRCSCERKQPLTGMCPLGGG